MESVCRVFFLKIKKIDNVPKVEKMEKIGKTFIGIASWLTAQKANEIGVAGPVLLYNAGGGKVGSGEISLKTVFCAGKLKKVGEIGVGNRGRGGCKSA